MKVGYVGGRQFVAHDIYQPKSCKWYFSVTDGKFRIGGPYEEVRRRGALRV